MDETDYNENTTAYYSGLTLGTNISTKAQDTAQIQLTAMMYQNAQLNKSTK